jgi:hypothetical protein
MRGTILAAVLIFSATTADAADVTLKDFRAETTESIMRLCTADEDKDLGKYAIGFCYGWIEGLEQLWGALLADERFGIKPISCPGKRLSRDETRTEFIRWIKANPSAMKLPPLEALSRAAKETYPCN